jgi:hypothetical protein
MHCVFGPLDQAGGGFGVPDGFPNPTVVVEHRQTVVLKPNADGHVAFALLSSPIGCIAVQHGDGTWVYNTAWFIDDGTVSNRGTWDYSDWVSYTSTSSPGNENDADWAVIPFKEWLMGSNISVLKTFDSSFKPTRFRVLTTQARASFTGSSLANGGTAATCRVDLNMTSAARQNFYHQQNPSDEDTLGSAGPVLLSMPPGTFGEIASSPGARIFPARESATLINPPTSFDMQDIRENFVPSYYRDTTINDEPVLVPVFYQDLLNPQDHTNAAAGPIGGFGHAGQSFYFATGLDPSATITVTARECVEYELSFASPSARFARAPPPKNQASLNKVLSLARETPSSIPTTPSVDMFGWLGEAGKWYLNTMRKAIGASWSAGGRIISALPGGAISGELGALATTAGKLMLTG